MKSKLFIICNSFTIFILASISHFIYSTFPSNLTAIFFPVNESIWEHMKLFYTPYLIDSILLFIASKKFNLVYHNILLFALISSLFSIFTYLIIYIPIFLIFKSNLIIDISLMIIVIITSQYLFNYILKKETSKHTNLILILIILIYILFGYLTYYPLRNFIFLDYSKNKYGRNIYILRN